jgi:hypothetical protein
MKFDTHAVVGFLKLVTLFPPFFFLHPSVHGIQMCVYLVLYMLREE